MKVSDKDDADGDNRNHALVNNRHIVGNMPKNIIEVIIP